MTNTCLIVCLTAAASAAQPTFELNGRVIPEVRASITLHAVASPFQSSKLIDGERFKFTGLEPGAYTISIFIPGRGEARKTIEIGPSTAAPLVLRLDDLQFVEREALQRQHAISAKQLSVPDNAMREYEAARRDLGRRDIESAIRRLERAVAIAPQFSAAWNNLGTIAYQTRKYARAEECFRKSLAADPDAYEPLVNLGGVLINLNNLHEAYQYNLFAVLARPNDALANSQMGMTYFGMGNLDLAEKYLNAARHLDPAHFSHPQLLLAEIHLRRGDRKSAAADLEDFLQHHPDWPQAAFMRRKIAEMK